MNDEIKEILEALRDSIDDTGTDKVNFINWVNKIEDYITNLQQDNEKIGKLWREEEAHCILLQQENERLKEERQRLLYNLEKVCEEDATTNN